MCIRRVTYLLTPYLLSYRLHVCRSVQARQIKCLRLVSTLQCVSNFAHLLDIRDSIKKTLKTIPRGSYDDRTSGYSRLFFRSQDHQTDELITDKPSNLKFCLRHHNEETFRSVYNLKLHLEEDNRLGSIIREQLNEVEMLAPDQIGNVNTGNQFLYGFGIAAEMITLVGIDELSLIVRVGQSVKCGLNLEEFEKALDEESRLLNHGLKTDANIESPIDVRPLLVNAFLREFDKYELITRGAIKTMRAVASALHGNTRNIAITKTSGGVFGIAGGVILIIGLALEPVTLGASTPLVITGITLVASSGAVSIGAAIGDAVKRNIIVTTMKQSLNEKVLLKTLSSLAEMIGTVHIPNQGLDPDSATPTELAKNVGRSVGDVARVGTATGLSAGLKVVGEGGLQALRNAFRFGAVAVGIVFDLVTVFDS